MSSPIEIINNLPENGKPKEGTPTEYGRIQRFDKYGHPEYHQAVVIADAAGPEYFWVAMGWFIGVSMITWGGAIQVGLRDYFEYGSQ